MMKILTLTDSSKNTFCIKVSIFNQMIYLISKPNLILTNKGNLNLTWKHQQDYQKFIFTSNKQSINTIIKSQSKDQQQIQYQFNLINRSYRYSNFMQPYKLQIGLQNNRILVGFVQEYQNYEYVWSCTYTIKNKKYDSSVYFQINEIENNFSTDKEIVGTIDFMTKVGKLGYCLKWQYVNGIRMEYIMLKYEFNFQILQTLNKYGLITRELFQLIAIVAFLYGTLTTLGQPLLNEQYQRFFFPRWFFNWAFGLVIGSVLGLIFVYLNKQSNMKKK